MVLHIIQCVTNELHKRPLSLLFWSVFLMFFTDYTISDGHVVVASVSQLCDDHVLMYKIKKQNFCANKMQKILLQ